MNDHPNRSSTPRRGKPPVKGLLGAVLVIGYWLLVPTLNARFGLELPELRDWNAGNAGQQADDAAADPELNESTASGKSTATDRSKPDLNSVADASSDDGAALKYGLLREVQPDRFLSPAGLMYGPGSQEGHRLQHLERHLQDAPTRAGPHGVFDGEFAEVLAIIDEGYQRAKAGKSGVTTEKQDQRTIYTINLGRRIGYVGGREGNRRDRPQARRLRIVLEGNRVITAFPL
ncbi:hypothetical protein SH139x_005257 [Planctomycetaceae bacterium SH139]